MAKTIAVPLTAEDMDRIHAYLGGVGLSEPAQAGLMAARKRLADEDRTEAEADEARRRLAEQEELGRCARVLQGEAQADEAHRLEARTLERLRAKLEGDAEALTLLDWLAWSVRYGP